MTNLIRSTISAYALAGALSLGACSTSAPAPAAVQTASAAAATISASVLSAADLAKLQAGCASAAGLLSIATSPVVPASVSGIAVYPAAYCQQLAAAPAGSVPATTTAGTASWWSTALAAAQDAAQIAGVVLPLLL